MMSAGKSTTEAAPSFRPAMSELESVRPARTIPVESAPASPMKILAGGKLKTKNPASPPKSAAARVASAGRPADAKRMARKKAAMADTPPERPSMLSIKLTAFTTATVQMIEATSARLSMGRAWKPTPKKERTQAPMI
jgi:hypothetical protein